MRSQEDLCKNLDLKMNRISSMSPKKLILINLELKSLFGIRLCNGIKEFAV